jgi:hypothetical protein
MFSSIVRKSTLIVAQPRLRQSAVRAFADKLAIPTDEQQGGRRRQELDAEAEGEVLNHLF